MDFAETHAVEKFGLAVLDIAGEWVVTNICHQSPRVVGHETVAVGPTTYPCALGHAMLWNAEPARATTWIVRRAVPQDAPPAD